MKEPKFTPLPEDLGAYIKCLDEIEAKWLAKEDQLEAERRDLPWWRIFRRSCIDAELSGVNIGLLRLCIERIDVRFRVGRTRGVS